MRVGSPIEIDIPKKEYILLQWRILQARGIEKILLKSPPQVREKFDVWVTMVEQRGPQALRAIKGFHDEALAGEWKGFRSSRLNAQYRVLYKIVEDQIEVHVLNVTPHDYRRR